MFQSRTVFVVGAGASAEFGLPLGSQLKKAIADSLNIRYADGYSITSGSHRIDGAYRTLASNIGERDINPWIHAGWQVRSAMPQATSIDNYLDAHRGNEKIEIAGKLAIAESILAAERNSALFYPPHLPPAMDFGKSSHTWISRLHEILVESAPKHRIEEIFRNISIITFNYDRCIEHYLAHALANYYGLDLARAQEIVDLVDIIHPYGMAGRLPWQKFDGVKVPFGHEASSTELITIAEQIKTFTERLDDEASVDILHQVISNSETIVFLGFAYHKPNMKLLTLPKSGATKRVFGTAFGISSSDKGVVLQRITRMLNIKPQYATIQLLDSGCSGLFEEFSRSISD
jgi:hypothetical protein